MNLPVAPGKSSPSLGLAAFGTFALAAGGASAANVTNGTVVYNDAPGFAATFNAPVSFDVEGNGVNDFTITVSSFDEGKVLGQLATANSDFVQLKISNLGETVGPAAGLMSNYAMGLSVGNNYAAFSLIDGSTLYGWARVSFSDTIPETSTIRVEEWAFDNSGQSIVVGSTAPIPEASSTALAMGALALVAGSSSAWRRRQTRLPAPV